MKNPRLKGVVERFAINKQINGDFWEKYQIFVNYLLLKELYFKINEEYPYESLLNISFLEDINFGKARTMAVDGCFIIYKKQIFHVSMDIEDLSESFAKFTDGNLHIVLVQTKTGKTETTSLSTLSDCLNTQFSGQEEWAKFINLQTICNDLLQSNDKIKINFSCFYVEGEATDKNLFNNNTFIVRLEGLKNAMKTFFWITSSDCISVDFYNDQDMYKIYEKQEENLSIVSKIVQYVNITSEINVPNVGKILFGSISFGELMKLIYDKEKQRRYELYGYNVRDEVKNSTIKSEIIKTIKEKGDLFILLNNGVTFIVDKQEKRGEKGITLENIRIVNGCQTCNAIIDVCKDTNNFDDHKVSMKIIETQKDEILLGSITYSSNNQNAVTKENLISIDPKMFELEKTFKDFELENRDASLESVLFERREGQFRGKSKKVIDTLALAKAYVSLWKGLPNECLMYREEILDKFVQDMKSNSDFITKALIAGILWHNIYKQIPSLYDNARYHIFAVLATHYLNMEAPQITQLSPSLIPQGIRDIINAIIEAKDDENEQIFPPNTAKGKIHYRKFYPQTALNEIKKNYDKNHKN